MNLSIHRARSDFRSTCFVSIFVVLFLQSSFSFAVSSHYKRNSLFIKELSDLKASIDLNYSETIENVDIPKAKIKKRLNLSKKDKRVEPIQLLVKPDKHSIRVLAQSLARDKKEREVEKLLNERLRTASTHDRMENRKVIDLVKPDFRYVSPLKFAQFFSRTHHNVQVDSNTLRNSPALMTELKSQLEHYLTDDEIKNFVTRVKKQPTVSVDENLLPPFARKVVKKYTVFRGPNCFHAAVAFNSPAIPFSQYLNVTIENDYHRAMINYDELWRILQTYFYEVKSDQPLKYGDVLVFFDIDDKEPINYRWIKHAAAYLFGPYTFSKGSKSANTPYTVKTLSEEWETWKKYTKNMGVKVYRNTQRDPKNGAPKDLLDWMY